MDEDASEMAQRIAEGLAEVGVVVLEVEDDLLALEGEWYSPHVSSKLREAGIDNDEHAGLITISQPSRPAAEWHILTSPSGGVTYLQATLSSW